MSDDDLYAGKGLVLEDEYKGFKYCICSWAAIFVPCAYIKIRINDYSRPNYNLVRTLIDEFCHGGITFEGVQTNPQVKIAGNLIGWDYGHICDYQPLFKFENVKKWTIEEIVSEIEVMIDRISTVPKKD